MYFSLDHLPHCCLMLLQKLEIIDEAKIPDYAELEERSDSEGQLLEHFFSTITSSAILDVRSVILV